MLSYSKYLFKCQTLEDFVPLRFFANTLRGGFGYAFKNIACHNRRSDCPECLLKSNCPYAIIFESYNTFNPSLMSKANRLPHPFVISPYPLPEPLEAGNEFKFEVILFGDVRRNLPFFIHSFIKLGAKGLGRDGNTFRVKSVSVIEPEETRAIYHAGENNISDPGYSWRWTYNGKGLEPESELLMNDITGIDKLKMELISPLRIKKRGKTARSREIEFDLIFKTLVRRLRAISSLYCNPEADYEFDEYLQQAEMVRIDQNKLRWTEQSRFSTRQKKKIDIGGLRGEITFRGNMDPFIGFLKAGEDLHIGNNTSFGLGKYKIIP